MMDALKEANGQELDIVEQMAHVIIQNTGGNADREDFWDKGERGLLKAIILYQYYIWKLGQGAASILQRVPIPIDATMFRHLPKHSEAKRH